MLNHRMASMNKIRRKITICFNNAIIYYTRVLTTFSKAVIVSIIFLSMLIGSGLRLWTQQMSSDIEHLYTPSDGKFIAERQSSFDLWPLNPDRFVAGRTYNLRMANVMILTLKNESNLLNSDNIKEMSEWNDYVTDEMVIRDRQIENTTFTFQDICLKYGGKCSFQNDHLFLLNYALEHDLLDKITFPRWEIDKHSPPIYVGHLIGGANLAPDLFHIRQIRAILLIYYIRKDPAYLDRSYDWEDEYERQIVRRFIQNESSIFRAVYLHSRSFYYSIDQFNVVRSAPKTTMIVAILAVATLALCTNFIDSGTGRWNIDFVNSKPFLGTCGLLSAMLANATAVGFWGYIGGTFSGSLQVTAFLSSAVGLDDMFIMTKAWSQSNNAHSPAHRLGNSLKYSIHSITITSVTSCLSFLIGCSSNFIGIVIFCIVMAMNMALNYLYIISFYATCLYLSGVIEYMGLENSVLYFIPICENEGTYGLMMKGYRKRTTKQKPPTENIKVSKSNINDNTSEHSTKFHCLLNSSTPKFSNTQITDNGATSNDFANELNLTNGRQSNQSPLTERQSSICNDSESSGFCSSDPLASFIYHYYSKYLLSFYVRIGVLVVYVIYLVVALYGFANTKIGIEPERLAPTSYHLYDYVKTEEKLFMRKGPILEIIVNNPPDCTKQANRKKLHKMVKSLENTDHTMSANATDFFLRDYEKFLESTSSTQADSPDNWEGNLYSWSTLSANKKNMEVDLKWIKVPGFMKRCSKCYHQLVAFRFRIGLRDYDSTEKQRKVLSLVRTLTQAYPSYNLTSYHHLWPWIEQFDSILQMAGLTIFYTIICMFLVATLFFQSAYCVFWTIFAVISIDIGVIGYMRFANVNLDFVSVIVIIMSIGLSVDYTAHIVHGFNVAKGDAIAKVRTALGSLGWPVLQGALTTLIGVAPLLVGDYYVLLVFGIVTSLSILFGMFHACVVLPSALSCSHQIRARFIRAKQKT